MQSEEESKCRCYKGCSDFQQIFKLKNNGLVIYRYSSQKDEAAVKSDYLEKIPVGDVYIFHNTTNLDITTNKYFSEFGQCLKCARCKYLFENACKLLKNISQINKFGIISLCDYCKSKVENNIPCKHCYEAVNKFIIRKNQKLKETSEFTQWANKIKNIFEIDKRKSRSHPELHWNEQRNITLGSRLYHELTSPLHDFKADSLTRTIKKQQYEYLLKRTQQQGYSSSNLNTIFTDFETIEYDKELRLKKYFDENNKVIGYSNTGYKRKTNELKYPSKYVHISLDDINSKFYDFDLPFLDNKYSSHTTIDHREIKTSDKYTINKIFKDGLSKQIDKFHPTVDREKILVQSNKKKSLDLSSEKSIVNFDETLAQGSLDKTFSFFFIKNSNAHPKIPRISKSSSELIKETQDVIHARAEKDKQQLKETKNILKETKIRDNQLKETKIRSKENEITDHEFKNKKPKLKSKTLIDETKEKVFQKEKEKTLDDKTENSTSAKLSHKNFNKNTSKLSITVSKNEKGNVIKSEGKEKSINRDILKVENESTKVKNELEKRQKIENEQREITKKEAQHKDKKGELKDKESNKKEKIRKSDKKDELEEFKKILAEQKKQKEDRAKKKVEENHKIKKETDKTVTQEVLLKSEETKTTKKQSKETKSDVRPEMQAKDKFKVKDEKTKDLQVNQIIVRTPSTDDLILRLVKLKQSYPRKDKERPKRLSEINIDPNVIAAHKCHQNKQSNCIICNDSELELDIENIVNKKNESTNVVDIIVGEKILKHKPHIEQKVKKHTISPLFFSSTLQDDVVNISKHDCFTNVTEEGVEKKTFTFKNGEQEVPKGIIRYALSDRTFIDKGWTMLPTEKVVRKMNVYRMRPAHPEFDWFEHNKNKKLMHYDTGEKLAEFDDNGRGRWFYRNGKLALDYYDAKEINAQQRFVIYSNGEPDERGRSRPFVILATFDYLGNGIVFDHAGKIRLKYNQTEGVVLDRSIGPVSHWKWHTLNDPPVLQQVMIDTQMAHKDPEILKLGGSADDKIQPDNEEMLAIEFENFIKEKSKKLSQKFKPFQIKMKALKINEHFSLKVLDQATVYLIFRDGSTNLKINIGMILDHKEIVDTDTAEVGEVSNSLERFPARTDSLAGLQKSVAYAQRVERARLERERRLRPTEPYTDKVTSVVSRPLRTPLNRVPSSTTATSAEYMCRCRKSSSCQLYYDTRLS
ncbi:unnamed protein product [Euphydryas editha]|uniref:FAM194 C-terminal domain-containing protein n=1 Tax=Euphydryas editha TaxID=104508 RepID=A0AAU9UUN3_EUPED|nr:unnamed protein product [Euphydryas editha]